MVNINLQLTRKKDDFEEKKYTTFEALILAIHGPKWEYTQRSADNKVVFTCVPPVRKFFLELFLYQ